MSRKPLVDDLSRAAAPPLRAWVSTNAERVEDVVDAALTAPAENVSLVQPVDFAAPTPLAFGDVADLADDGLTDEERKRALAWLKKRAARTEGAFDAQEARIALSLLPGWKSEVVPGSLTVSTEPPKVYNYGSREREIVVPESVAREYAVLPKGKKSKDMPPGKYAEKIVSFAEAVGPVEEITRAYAYRTGWYDARPGSVGYRTHAETVQLPGSFAGHLGERLFVLVKHAVVTADPTKQALRVTNPEGETVEVGGKAGWRALYGEHVLEGRRWRTVGGLGLAEAAKGVVDALQRKVETHDALAQAQKGGWGGALCPVCFQRAAVTPASRHMVDHRHTRPGWGYNVAPCRGNLYPPYKESPEGTKAQLAGLRNRFDALNTDLRDMLAHPEKQTYTVNVYINDANGRPIYDTVSITDKWGRSRTEEVRREKEVAVRQGHPLFRDLYRDDAKARREHIRAVADSIPFYVAAVRVWEKGLDSMAPIFAAMRRESDTPALPADLFPAG